MHVTKNYGDQGGNRWVVGGELKLAAGAQITGDGAANLAAVANGTTLGGVKAVAKGAGDTVEVKIDEDGKLYVPEYPDEYTLPNATAEDPGGVYAAENQAAIAADATLDALRTAYIDLVLKLKEAGIMIADGGGPS